MQKSNDSLERMRQHYLKTSPYNTTAPDYRFTACVGANGHYGQDTICDGFSDAVQILIDSLASGSGTSDSLVYPILFCARHTFELYLKDIYNSIQFIYCAKTHKNEFIKLQKLYKIKYKVSKRVECCKYQLDPHHWDMFTSTDEASIRKRIGIWEKRLELIDMETEKLYSQCFSNAELDLHTHNLSDLKDKILSIYQIDSRIPNMFNQVLPFLIYYEKIDPNGDAFRYQASREGEPHLENKRIGLVNLLTVGLQHEEISKILQNTRMLLYHLKKEYMTGTFTKDLSREQLSDISKLLPKPEEFTKKIHEVRELIKSQYQIGSNKFNEVLALIRKHREFSCNMGKEIKFPFLSEATLKNFGECAIGKRDWNSTAAHITFDELCLLWTFSDISGWRYEDGYLSYYSEDLNYLYRRAIFERRITLYDINPEKEISHIIVGMKKCGQITYANILSEYT